MARTLLDKVWEAHTVRTLPSGQTQLLIGLHLIHEVTTPQAFQMLKDAKLKVRQVRVEGALARGVYAKDVILSIINQLGVKGGVGYAYEYAGPVIERMTMEERLTVCNMSIEGGARCGYVNPDQTTIDYVRGKPHAPSGDKFDRAAAYWKSVATEPGAAFDDVARIDGASIEPVVTWGINPEMSVGVSQRIPSPDSAPEPERPTYREALAHMGFQAGQPIKGARIDVAFVGSCTNGRLSDLRIAAEVARKGKVAKHVRALIVPGSQQVAKAAEAEGLDQIFVAAGFQWRKAGCSMCLGMNDDKLQGREMSASSSNRNFIGRQGSPTGRTLLMSPAMVAAAAITGVVTDVREILK